MGVETTTHADITVEPVGNQRPQGSPTAAHVNENIALRQYGLEKDRDQRMVGAHRMVRAEMRERRLVNSAGVSAMPDVVQRGFPFADNASDQGLHVFFASLPGCLASALREMD